MPGYSVLHWDAAQQMQLFKVTLYLNLNESYAATYWNRKLQSEWGPLSHYAAIADLATSLLHDDNVNDYLRKVLAATRLMKFF